MVYFKLMRADEMIEKMELSMMKLKELLLLKEMMILAEPCNS